MRSVTVVPGETRNVIARPATRPMSLGVKYLVSTTSVSPSHQPIESPDQDVTAAGRVPGVEPDDAREAHHFRDDHHGVLRLHDLAQIGAGVVEIRRLRGRVAETTLGRRTLLGTVQRVHDGGARLAPAIP